MITANALRLSFIREMRALGVGSLRLALRWTVPACMAVFVLMDGLVFRNSLSWAGPFRALESVVIFAAGLLILTWYRVRLNLVIAAVAGIVAALVAAQMFQSESLPDVTLWVFVIGALVLQCTIGRDWSEDFARAALLLSALGLVMVAGSASGIPAPSGLLNRNVFCGVLVALLPSAIERGGAYWWRALAPMATIVLLGSRGAILAMAAVLVFMGWRVTNRRVAIGAAVLVALALILLVPESNANHVLIMRSAVQQWVSSSSVFGVGPGGIWIPVPWSSSPDVQAHNSALTIAVTTGLLGACVIGFALAMARRGRLQFQPWQVGTVIALLVHGLVDDPLTWLPTLLIGALAVGKEDDSL